MSNIAIQTRHHGRSFSNTESLMIQSNEFHSKGTISVRKPRQDELKEILGKLGMKTNNIPEKVGLQDVILICVEQAVQRLGHNNKHEQDNHFTTEEVFSWVKNYKFSLTIQELCLAIKLGSQGEYNEDVVYVSATNVIRWIKRYINKRESVFLSLKKAKEKEALKTADNESSEKEVAFWSEFPEMVEKEFIYFQENKVLSNQRDLVVSCLEKIGFKSSDGKFLSDVVSGEQKKVFMFEEKKKAIAKEVQEKEKTMIAFSEKGVNEKGLEKEILRNSKARALEFYFKGITEIDLEEIKQLIK